VEWLLRFFPLWLQVGSAAAAAAAVALAKELVTWCGCLAVNHLDAVDVARVAYRGSIAEQCLNA
jgi:hypothetical protein